MIGAFARPPYEGLKTELCLSLGLVQIEFAFALPYAESDGQEAGRLDDRWVASY